MTELVQIPLLLLPVHLSSRAAYEARVKSLSDKKKAGLERVYGRPLTELPPGLRTHSMDVGFQPPWLLNYVVGWIVLGLDSGDSLCGDVYCRRKDLPRKLLDLTYYERSFTANNQWTHCGELCRYSTQTFKDDADHAQALLKLAEEGRDQFRRAWPRWRKCEAWIPPFGLECNNWVDAIRMASERAG